MEGVKTWLSSLTSLTQAYKIPFPDTTSASIPVVTTLRSSLSMYVFFIIKLFSHYLFYQKLTEGYFPNIPRTCVYAYMDFFTFY
jgi:hypothetical protein